MRTGGAFLAGLLLVAIPVLDLVQSGGPIGAVHVVVGSLGSLLLAIASAAAEEGS